MVTVQHSLMCTACHLYIHLHSHTPISKCLYTAHTAQNSATHTHSLLNDLMTHIYIPVLPGHNYSTFRHSKVACRTLLHPPPGATTTLTFQMTCLKNQSNSDSNSLPYIDAQPTLGHIQSYLGSSHTHSPAPTLEIQTTGQSTH
jgi:hypothetical protein